MALVTPVTEHVAGRPLPWPFRNHRLTVALLALLVAIVWRVFLVSHFSIAIGALELVVMVALMGWMAWRIIQRWLDNDWRLNGLEIYAMVLLLVPLLSAVAARREYDQPFIWGLVAFKDYYLLLGVLVVHRWLRRGWITLGQVEQALLAVAWACLIYFYFATLFINPAPYQDSPLAGANDVKGGGVYYRFNMCALYFGAIYYAARGFMRNRWTDLVYAALFAAYVVVFRMDRTSMAVTAVGMVGAVLWNVPWQRIAKVALVAFLPTLFAAMLVLLLAPAKVEQYKYMFMDALHTVTGAQEQAAEVSVRTVEAAIAKRQVAKHPWIGNGRISRSWNEQGYDGYYGFFYPADVGMLGLVFLYGYPGTVLLYLLFPIAALWAWRTRGWRHDLFLVAARFTLLALFLDSLTNGQLTQTPGQALLFAAILHYCHQMRPDKAEVDGTAPAMGLA